MVNPVGGLAKPVGYLILIEALEGRHWSVGSCRPTWHDKSWTFDRLVHPNAPVGERNSTVQAL